MPSLGRIYEKAVPVRGGGGEKRSMDRRLAKPFTVFPFVNVMASELRRSRLATCSSKKSSLDTFSMIGVNWDVTVLWLGFFGLLGKELTSLLLLTRRRPPLPSKRESLST
uniref:Uncharacterized protein n=1 Tax=Glossina brevipalpis TaxID=37001 RepID=A0A1A9WV01_9MUSC